MRAAAVCCCLLAALAAVAAADASGATRDVYLVRHGEAQKNLITGREADNPQNDRLTPQGQQQAAATGSRLSGVGLTAVESAPEQRTRDTAYAITSRAMLSSASIDSDLTSKTYSNESPEARASRGAAAVRRFLARTSGAVAFSAHGHLINLTTAKLTGAPLTSDVIKSEIVNGGVVHLRVTGLGTSGERWQLLSTDAVVRDD